MFLNLIQFIVSTTLHRNPCAIELKSRFNGEISNFQFISRANTQTKYQKIYLFSIDCDCDAVGIELVNERENSRNEIYVDCCDKFRI